LLLIAIATTFFSIGLFCDAHLAAGEELTFAATSGIFYLKGLFYSLSQATVFIFLAYAFNRRIPFPLLLLIIAFTLLAATNDFVFTGKLGVPLGISFVMICLYFIIPSWKNIKGAQWAVVGGVLLTAIWSVLWAYNSAKYQPVFPFPFA